MHRRTAPRALPGALLLALAASPAVGPVGAAGAAAQEARPAASPVAAPPAAEAAAAVIPAETASLVVANRPIVVFRGPMGAATPRERAEAAFRRIASLAEAGSADTVATALTPEGVLVLVGSRRVFTVTPAEADTLAGETVQAAAERAAEALELALAAEREQRSVLRLLRALVLALGASALFILTLRGVGRVHAAALSRLATAGRPRLPRLAIGSHHLLTPEQLLASTRRMIELATWGARLFLAYLWLTFVLTRFPYSRPWGEALGAYLLDTLRELAGGALRAVPGLFTVAVIALAARFLARLVAEFFRAVEAGTVTAPWVHPETAQPTRRLAVALVWVFAIVIAYPYLPGSDSNIFKGVTVFVGIMLSLGSTSLVNQAMSGLVLMYSRALKAGDYVRVGDVEGTVTALGTLSVKVLTPKQEEVTIPNAVVVGAETKNYSRFDPADGLILYTTVTIGYDVPWRQVEALLLLAAERTPGLRRDLPAFVQVAKLSDFYVEYQLNVRIDRPHERRATLAALHARIVDAFNEYGVQILSPHYEGDPVRPAVVPADRWYAPPARAEPVEPGPAAEDGEAPAADAPPVPAHPGREAGA